MGAEVSRQGERDARPRGSLGSRVCGSRTAFARCGVRGRLPGAVRTTVLNPRCAGSSAPIGCRERGKSLLVRGPWVHSESSCSLCEPMALPHAGHASIAEALQPSRTEVSRVSFLSWKEPFPSPPKPGCGAGAHSAPPRMRAQLRGPHPDRSRLLRTAAPSSRLVLN